MGVSASFPKSGSLSTSLSLDPLVSVSISVSNYWTSLVSISVSSLDQTWARSRSRSQSQKCWSRRLLVCIIVLCIEGCSSPRSSWWEVAQRFNILHKGQIIWVMINKESVRSTPLNKEMVIFSPSTVRTLRWPHKKTCNYHLSTTSYLWTFVSLVKGDVKDKVGGSKS